MCGDVGRCSQPLTPDMSTETQSALFLAQEVVHLLETARTAQTWVSLARVFLLR